MFRSLARLPALAPAIHGTGDGIVGAPGAIGKFVEVVARILLRSRSVRVDSVERLRRMPRGADESKTERQVRNFQIFVGKKARIRSSLPGMFVFLQNSRRADFGEKSRFRVLPLNKQFWAGRVLRALAGSTSRRFTQHEKGLRLAACLEFCGEDLLAISFRVSNTPTPWKAIASTTASFFLRSSVASRSTGRMLGRSRLFS